jgi:hypothetical protein
VSLRGSHPTP